MHLNVTSIHFVSFLSLFLFGLFLVHSNWQLKSIIKPGSLPRSRFSDVMQRCLSCSFGGALHDIQKTAARETIILETSKSKVLFKEMGWVSAEIIEEQVYICTELVISLSSLLVIPSLCKDPPSHPLRKNQRSKGSLWFTVANPVWRPHYFSQNVWKIISLAVTCRSLQHVNERFWLALGPAIKT